MNSISSKSLWLSPQIWCKSMSWHFLIMLHRQKFHFISVDLLPSPQTNPIGFISLLAFICSYFGVCILGVLKT